MSYYLDLLEKKGLKLTAEQKATRLALKKPYPLRSYQKKAKATQARSK